MTKQPRKPTGAARAHVITPIQPKPLTGKLVKPGPIKQQPAPQPKPAGQDRYRER